MRFFIYLSYKGTAYNGWQIQSNATSVQQTLQQALSTLLRENIVATGAGRTDTGVHASYYVAHFDTKSPAIVEKDDFCYHLNAVLPRDIAVSSIEQVADDAHARFDATLREYKYYVVTRKDPFRTDTAYFCSAPLNIDRMNEAAAILKDYEDFTSFCKLHSDNKTNICHIEESYWRAEGDSLIYTISADRFLRNMVRSIVGSLLRVGSGKANVDDFRAIIESRSIGAAAASAPACGLFLTNIKYDNLKNP